MAESTKPKPNRQRHAAQPAQPRPPRPVAAIRVAPRVARAAVTTGRDRLIDAAMNLGFAARNIGSLGLRELSREAGLNPNTFYRHFKNFDELGLAVIEKLGGQLRTALRARREREPAAALSTETAVSLQAIVRASVELVFDFALEHRAAYVIAIRELHGSSPVLRKALAQMMDNLATEMAEDTMRLIQVPELDFATVHELSELIIRQMGFMALEYIEQPKRREAQRRKAERFILLLFWGALAAKAPEALADVNVSLPEG